MLNPPPAQGWVVESARHELGNDIRSHRNDLRRVLGSHAKVASLGLDALRACSNLLIAIQQRMETWRCPNRERQVILKSATLHKRPQIFTGVE
jgi:hypothetical protein